jgi:hypothetical protein
MAEKLKYININKELIPYEFDIVLDKKLYVLGLNYNYTYDFFSVDLYRNKELILSGEKLVYGLPLFVNYQYLDVPKNIVLIPLDITEDNNDITYDNFNESVFIYIFNKDELEEQ